MRLIETRPVLVRGSIIKFGYRVFRKGENGAPNTLLAEGDTTHVVCDAAMRRKPLPSEYVEALKSMQEA